MSANKKYDQNQSEAEPFPALSEAEVREALGHYVAERCCYGRPRELSLADLRNAPVFLYTLELGMEERTSCWVTKPYRGEFLEPQAGPKGPVDIWNIRVPAPAAQSGDRRKVVEVPGTLSVSNCSGCSGVGKVQCGKCAGATIVPCLPCMGQGVFSEINEAGGAVRQACLSCGGKGRVGCEACGAKGVCPCKTCLGFRRVKNYERLEVRWSSCSVTATRRTGSIRLKRRMLEGLTRTLVAEDRGPSPSGHGMLRPFGPVMDRELARFDELPSHRVVDAVQRVYVFPATEATLQWKGRREPFIVYGRERRVRFPDKYPQSCLWTTRCSIL